MHIELFGVSEVSPDRRHQPSSVEALGTDRVKVRSEDMDSLAHSVGSPLFRAGDLKKLLPSLQVGDDLESPWDFSTSVATEKFAYFSIHSSHFRIIERLRLNLNQLILQCFLPVLCTLSTNAQHSQEIHLVIVNDISHISHTFSHLNHHLFLLRLCLLPSYASSLLLFLSLSPFLPFNRPMHPRHSLMCFIPLRQSLPLPLFLLRALLDCHC